MALLACGGAYWPLALEPSAMTSRHPYYCGHPHCCRHPPAWVGIQNAISADGVFPDGLISAWYAVITKTPGWEVLTTTSNVNVTQPMGAGGGGLGPWADWAGSRVPTHSEPQSHNGTHLQTARKKLIACSAQPCKDCLLDCPGKSVFAHFGTEKAPWKRIMKDVEGNMTRPPGRYQEFPRNETGCRMKNQYYH